MAEVKKRRVIAPSSMGRETDEKRLTGRQKQIDYGKNTVGYERYLATVTKYYQL